MLLYQVTVCQVSSWLGAPRIDRLIVAVPYLVLLMSPVAELGYPYLLPLLQYQLPITALTFTQPVAGRIAHLQSQRAIIYSLTFASSGGNRLRIPTPPFRHSYPLPLTLFRLVSHILGSKTFIRRFVRIFVYKCHSYSLPFTLFRLLMMGTANLSLKNCPTVFRDSHTTPFSPSFDFSVNAIWQPYANHVASRRIPPMFIHR